MKNVTKMKKKPIKNASLGEKIEYVRREKLMSQEKLAELIGGRKREEIIMWEKDRTGKRKPDIYTFKEIAKALEVSTDFLLGLTDFESTNDDYKTVNKVTGLNDKAISILEYYKLYNPYLLIPTINFLIGQEELPPDESHFEALYQKLETIKTTKENKAKKTKCEDKINEIYEKAIKEWESKDYKPIISMIESYFTVEVENQEIYTRENDFNNEICNTVFPKKIIASKDLVDRDYLSRITNQLEKLKEKYLKKKEDNNKQ